jgi:hypothetical protein
MTMEFLRVLLDPLPREEQKKALPPRKKRVILPAL